MPPFKDVTSVSAIPFTEDGKLVVVNLRHRGLDLPGGHVEQGELSPLDTVTREVMEEACMTVKNLTLAEVIVSDYYPDRPTYMLLYAAFVNELLEFAPNDEASERVVINQKDFISRYQAGNKDLMQEAVYRAWALLTDKRN